MTREQVWDIIGDIDDRFVAEADQFDPKQCSRSPERIEPMKRKRIITFALAAALLLALGIGAYASDSAFSTRVPEPEEAFRIHWEENAGGYIEWTDAKLAVTFPETAESREIEFRPGWLPVELPTQLPACIPWDDLSADTWFQRLSLETLADRFPDMTASQPLLIETYYMSMFNDGGALLLLDYMPEDIIEEHWDEQNVDVMRFHATQHLEARPAFNVPERTLEQDILLMSNAEAGWVVRICGEAGMDALLEVAKNLEIRETGRTLTYDDFEDHYTFMDGGVG